MAKIRDTENSQCVAELTQKISNLEFKVAVLFLRTQISIFLVPGVEYGG